MFFHMKTEGHWNHKDGNLGTLLVFSGKLLQNVS